MLLDFGMAPLGKGESVSPYVARCLEVVASSGLDYRLYAETTLFPQPTRWRDAIPWVLDLEEGIRLAKQEKRPLLLWTSGDDPLERC